MCYMPIIRMIRAIFAPIIHLLRRPRHAYTLSLIHIWLPLAFSLMGSLARLLGLSRYFRSILLQTGSYTAVGRIQRLPVAASAKKKSRETKLCPGQRPESRLFVYRHPCGDQLAEGCFVAHQYHVVVELKNRSGAERGDGTAEGIVHCVGFVGAAGEMCIRDRSRMIPLLSPLCRMAKSITWSSPSPTGRTSSLPTSSPALRRSPTKS